MPTKIAKLIARNVSPKHVHDCNACCFLGRLDGRDLYRCRADGSYVSRYGDDGPEAVSLGEFTPVGSGYSLAAEIIKRKIDVPNEYVSTLMG